MTDARPASTRSKILMVVLSPLVVFGLLELGLRIGGFRYVPGAVDPKDATHAELGQKSVYAPDPELLWTLHPSTILDIPELGFDGLATNALGLRGSIISGPKAAGELRVLCLGDSVTFGLGLADGETWPDRMEETLRAVRGLSGRKVRVLIGAVPGWSSVQGMRFLERHDDLEPDIIVFWYGMNDARPRRGLPDSAQVLLPEGGSRVFTVAENLRVFQLVRLAVTGLRTSTAEGTRVGRAEFAENVRRLLEIDRAGGPRVVFVRPPDFCALTISQLESVVAQAEAAKVDLVMAPTRLLQWFIPAPEDADLIGKRDTWRRRPVIRFPPLPSNPDYDAADEVMGLDDVRENLQTLVTQKLSFDAILGGLPEKSLGYDELFGEAHPTDVLMDNCHLNEQGARLVGAALAKEVLRVYRAP